MRQLSRLKCEYASLAVAALLTPSCALGAELSGDEPSATIDGPEMPPNTASGTTIPNPCLSAAQAAPVAALCRQLAAQQQAIAAQDRRIRALELRIGGAALAPPALEAMRGTGEPAMAAPAPAAVGEAPPPAHDLDTRTTAVPPAQGVLTPAGKLVVEEDLEYVRAANDRLVFSGIELIPGLQLGVISAQTSDSDTFAPSLNMRYGITSRLEADMTVPFLSRRENIQVVQQRDGQIVRNLDLHKAALGDIEFGLRYQLNPDDGPDHPIWILNLKAKSASGIGPYDVGYDQYGIATGLPTGSGFWGIEPGVSVLVPSDPVVIFASANYLWQLPHTLNKSVGGALVGRVNPGGAIQANTGFAFALNPRFSFSLGYTHTYVKPTDTFIGSAWQKSRGLQVGTFDFGMSYKVTERQLLNLQFQFGVTPDAPSLNLTLRLPFST